MAFPSKNGTATRAVALDLMLRTFMNSADFQPYNPRVWESVAKLVPGTTPQQCIRRWEELRATNRVPQRDLSTLSAKGRPISAQDRRQASSANSHHTADTYLLSSSSTPTHNKMIYAQESAPHMTRGGEGELPPLYSNDPLPRPVSVCDSRPTSRLSTGSGYRLQGGKFAASFCQTHLSSPNDTKGKDSSNHELGTVEKRRSFERFKNFEQKKDTEQELTSSSPVGRDNSNVDIRSECSIRSLPSSASTASAGGESVQTPPPQSHDTTRGKSEPLMVIHVHDEAKKINKDFMCTREVLVREMRYFSNYLSTPESQQWEEVDISVHCDVTVFEWLMTYTKQGMMEGPTGEKLTQPLAPPQLEPGNVVAVLISSDFLKMEKLVEECLVYCHAHMSEIIASPCNMNCIGSTLLSRLAKLYSPLELEDITDPKDKVKSKLYQQMLQRLFNHSYTHPQCPTNAATLFKCQHCGKVMTDDQATVLHCLPHRVTVDKSSQLLHKHVRNDQWDVSQYLKSLRPAGTSWRALYWRVWGVINWLLCAKCGQSFQCSNLHTCPYHPDATKLTTELAAGKVRSILRYTCCGQPETSFSPMALKQSGCCYRQHIVAVDNTTSSDHQNSVYHTLLRVKEIVCPKQSKSRSSNSPQSRPEAHLLKNEQRERQYLHTESRHQYTQPVSVTKDLPSPIASNKESHSLSLSRHSPKANSRKQLRRVHQRHQVMDEDGEDSDGSDSDSSPSEVEEDEVDTPQNIHVSNAQRKKKSKKIRTSKSKIADRMLAPEAAAVVPPHNWLWDCTKSNRLNQDLQRYSDEQRIDQLSEQLRTDPCFTISDASSTSSSASTKGSTQYAGGIYCRIEAQFRSHVITANKSSANNSRSSRKKS